MPHREQNRSKVAYLVNQYPKVSHTFIRREIAALEALGQEVARFSIRWTGDQISDDADRAELARTRAILSGDLRTKLRLAAMLVLVACTRPMRMLQALKLAVKIGWRSERGLLLHAAYIAEACVLVRWLEEEGCTHLHAHFGTNSTTVAMLVKALGGPDYSFTVHGPEEFDKPDLIALKEKIHQATFVAGVSDFGRSQLYRHSHGDEWKKIHVVPCGVDDKFLADVSLSPVPSAPRLVCVGRLCEQKGQLLLVEAAARLAARGFEFELVLVGDGEMRPAIEKLIAAHGLEQRVRITGWASGDVVREHLLASRALVLPSFAEGLPVVLMEALAMGRPVVSTYVAGIPELVTPGKSGWLVPAGSISDLVVALEEVLQATPEHLSSLGAAGHARVRERHDARFCAETLMKLLPTRRAIPASR